MSCFREQVGVKWWENGERTGSVNELLLIFFSFSQSQTLTVNVSITKELPAQEANLVASV